MGQRRVEETLVDLSEAARLLGVEPAEVQRILRRRGVGGQRVQVAERRAIVYGLAPVAVDGSDEPAPRDVLVGTTTIAEILDKPPANIVKMLDRRRVEKQTVAIGRRKVTVWLREDVERVRREENRRARERAKAAKA